MAKVSIIHVDLGSDIEDIIKEDVAKLTDNAQAELDAAISKAKTIDEVKNKSRTAKQLQTERISTALNSIYNKLLKAGPAGLPETEILNEALTVISTQSAFTIRLKGLLKENNNEYILERFKANKEWHYGLKPFNSQQSELPSDVSPEQPTSRSGL